MKTKKMKKIPLYPRPDFIFMKNLKVGDKFYESDYKDSMVYVLLDLIIDDTNPDIIKYVVRVFKSNTILEKAVRGNNVRESYYVFRYSKRDRSSYIAGFQSCMKLYHDHMQIFDRENAGLDDAFKTYCSMNNEFNKWKHNIT